MIIQSPSVDSFVVPNVCGVAVVHRRDVLLLKRARQKFGAGLWGLPAGKQEGQESLLRTAIRELKEETGIDLAEELLTFVECFYVVPSTNALGPFRFHLYTTRLHEKPSAIVRSETEHDEDRWVELNDIELYPFIEDGITVLQRSRSFCLQP